MDERLRRYIDRASDSVLRMLEKIEDWPQHLKPDEDKECFVALDGNRIVKKFYSIGSALYWQCRNPEYTVMPFADYEPVEEPVTEKVRDTGVRGKMWVRPWCNVKLAKKKGYPSRS